MVEPRRLRPAEIMPGRDYIEVDRIPNPDDPDDAAEIYEQVLMIEDMGRCYRVFTEHQQVIVEEDVEVEVRDER